MKMKIRVLTVLAVLALLFSGVVEMAAQSGDTAIPAYTETDITAKAALTRPGAPMKTTDDGLIVLYDIVKDAQVMKFLDSTGATVKSFPVDVPGGIHTFAIDSIGNICAFTQDPVGGKSGSDTTAFKRLLVVYSTDGKKLKTIDLGQIAYDKNNPWYLTDLAVDGKGNIYASTSKGIEVFDAQGRPGRQLASYNAQGIGVDLDGKLYAVGYSVTDYKSFLDKIDPATGKQIWRVALGDMPLALRLNRKAKTIAVLDMRFVTIYTTDGKQIARVFDLKSSSIVGQQTFNASFTVDPTGNVYFISRKPGAKDTDPWTSTFYRYSRSTQVAQKKNTLTISHGFWYDRFPDIAIGAFQKANPDWTVEYGRMIEEKDMSSMDQIMTSITTELMAGRGADLITLSRMPYRDFVDKGLLVNLDQMAASDKAFSMGALRQNALSAFRYKGGLYSMPSAFLQNIVAASKKVLDEAKVSIKDTEWTWQDFFAIADKVRKDTNGDGVVDRFALPKLDGAYIFHLYVLPSVLDSYYNREKKQANFTDPGFIELLKATKSFAERNGEKNPFGPEKWTDGTQNGSIVFFLNYMQGPLDPQMQSAIFKGDAQILSRPGSGGGGDEATCFFLAGVNKSSRNAQKAWEFLKLMVSEQVQLDQNLYGFPINSAAYTKRVQSLKDATAKGQVSGGFGAGSFFMFAPLTDKDIALVDGFVARIKRSEYTDSRLSSILSAELKDFFAGTRSAEDACKSLQQKVTTYLQE